MSTESQSETLTENPPPVGAPEPTDVRASSTPAEEAEPAADAPAPSEPKEEQGKASPCYDSEARQRIPVTLILDDGRYDVALVCEPATDAVLLSYARLCEAADASESAEDEDAGAAQIGATAGAVGWLFGVLMSDVEGVGEEGEEKPADWREIFGPQERQAIVDRALFGIEPVEPPPAKKGKRPAWGSHLRAVVNRFRVPFNGRTVDVSHTLRKADARQLGEFVSLYGRTFGRGRAGDANMEKFAAGYDRLHVAHSGYRGAVPMHHKAVAYIGHMTRQGAALRKN